MGTDTQTLLGDSAGGITRKLNFRGTEAEFTIHRITFGVKAQFEDWIKQRELKGIQDLKPLLDNPDYLNLVKEFRLALANGEFAFDSPKGQQMFSSMDGQLEILRLMFSKSHPDLTIPDLVDLLTNNGEKVEEILLILHPELSSEVINLKNQ